MLISNRPTTSQQPKSVMTSSVAVVREKRKQTLAKDHQTPRAELKRKPKLS